MPRWIERNLSSCLSLVLQCFSSESSEKVKSSAYWPLSVIGCVLWGLFQQRDVDQSTSQNEEDSHSVGSPAEKERETDINNVWSKKNVIQATGGLSKKKSTDAIWHHINTLGIEVRILWWLLNKYLKHEPEQSFKRSVCDWEASNNEKLIKWMEWSWDRTDGRRKRKLVVGLVH